MDEWRIAIVGAAKDGWVRFGVNKRRAVTHSPPMHGRSLTGRASQVCFRVPCWPLPSDLPLAALARAGCSRLVTLAPREPIIQKVPPSYAPYRRGLVRRWGTTPDIRALRCTAQAGCQCRPWTLIIGSETSAVGANHASEPHHSTTQLPCTYLGMLCSTISLSRLTTVDNGWLPFPR